ncbi:MAG: FtsX-like permease family protein [Anaerolineae bacterium]|nr:FtsX-like permease family protein [Anaerolineae bacterium]
MKTSTWLQMARMAWQYLKRRKLRTALTTLAIVFGVALIFAINLIMPSVLDIMKESLESETEVVDLSIVDRIGESFDPAPLTETLLKIDGVEGVSGVLRRRIILPADNNPLGDISRIEMIGVDPATQSAVRTYDLREGQMPKAEGEAVVSAELGKLGETIAVTTANGLKSYTIVGLLKDDPTVERLIVTLPDAQTALNLVGRVNLLEVAFSAGVDTDKLSSQIEETLGDHYLYNVTSEEEFSFAEVAYLMLNLFGMIALFMGGFLIFNTFRTVVIERRHDLAMLRAIGATRRQVMQLILIESVLQGVLGTLLGLVLGYLLTLTATDFLGKFLDQFMAVEDLEITFQPGAFAIAIGMGVLSTLLAGYWPARRAGRTSPLDALRPMTASDLQKANRWSLIIGFGIMVVAVLMLIGSDSSAAFGAILFLIGAVIAGPGLVVPVARLFNPLLTLWFAREGDLARNNLIRQPGRAAITASTLMIGLATFIMVATLVSGIVGFTHDLVESNFASDVMLIPPAIATYSSLVGADENLGNQLRELPEVELVSELRHAASVKDNLNLDVFGIDPNTYPQVAPFIFVKGDPEQAYADLSQGRTMIMNSFLASSLNLEVGDEFTLPTVEGDQQYRLVGIGNDVLNLKLNAIFISHENLQADFHKSEAIMLMIDLTPGADETAAKAQIESVAQDYPQFTVKLAREYRENMIEAVESSIGIYYTIAILILIPAALGLLNTLTINILERTREIGIVRAVGGSRKQVRRIVIAEALLLGLFGAAVGVLVGVAMSYGFTLVFTMIGWKVPYVFPAIGIIAAIIIAIMLGLFSSILPARNAARLDIIRALQYE